MKEKFLMATVLVALTVGSVGYAGLVFFSNHIVVQNETAEDLHNVELLLSRGTAIALPDIGAGQQVCFTLNSYEGSVGLQAQMGLTMLKLPATGYVTGGMGANIYLTAKTAGIFMRDSRDFDWSCLFAASLTQGKAEAFVKG